MCDASAGVSLGRDFFIVASDEDNLLRIYRKGHPEPVVRYDLSDQLDLEEEHPETDLEGATRLGDRIYWITSHGRNAAGKKRPNRRRIFATTVERTGDTFDIRISGEIYTHLLQDIQDSSALDGLNLQEAWKLPPEAPGGFNIEGLASNAAGDLLIGLRNPLVEGKAIILRLTNPGKIIAGQRAKFGDPILVDLGGRGIRSLERIPGSGRLLIVAGPIADVGTFELFEWAGTADSEPDKSDSVGFDSMRPEALFFDLETPSRISILSDDGGLVLEGTSTPCKESPEADRAFRLLETMK